MTALESTKEKKVIFLPPPQFFFLATRYTILHRAWPRVFG
jgi:hypothetical protein